MAPNDAKKQENNVEGRIQEWFCCLRRNPKQVGSRYTAHHFMLLATYQGPLCLLHSNLASSSDERLHCVHNILYELGSDLSLSWCPRMPNIHLLWVPLIRFLSRFRFQLHPTVKAPMPGWVNLPAIVKYTVTASWCNVPRGYSKNIKLGRWVSTQRKQYKLHAQGKIPSLTHSRIQKLESLGFEWDRSISQGKGFWVWQPTCQRYGRDHISQQLLAPSWVSGSEPKGLTIGTTKEGSHRLWLSSISEHWKA
jgi:hypothetical protein